jgi:hypothetical protein
MLAPEASKRPLISEVRTNFALIDTLEERREATMLLFGECCRRPFISAQRHDKEMLKASQAHEEEMEKTKAEHQSEMEELRASLIAQQEKEKKNFIRNHALKVADLEAKLARFTADGRKLFDKSNIPKNGENPFEKFNAPVDGENPFDKFLKRDNGGKPFNESDYRDGRKLFGLSHEGDSEGHPFDKFYKRHTGPWIPCELCSANIPSGDVAQHMKNHHTPLFGHANTSTTRAPEIPQKPLFGHASNSTTRAPETYQEPLFGHASNSTTRAPEIDQRPLFGHTNNSPPRSPWSPSVYGCGHCDFKGTYDAIQRHVDHDHPMSIRQTDEGR